MANHLKVYHLPLASFLDYDGTTPTITTVFVMLKTIFKKEGVQIVHSHSDYSTLSHEAVLVGSVMGLKTAITLHSLRSFANTEEILMSSLARYSFSATNCLASVSYALQKNVNQLHPLTFSKSYVVPNALCSQSFQPDYNRVRPKDKIVIVFSSRIHPEKGINLLLELIPNICSMVFKGNVTADFLIAGGGSELGEIEGMITRHGLHHRVKLLGAVPASDVRSVLVQGDIFLNTSLVEAFCIAILEAVSCGLLTVSTNVGGIPEIVHDRFIHLCDPDVNSLEKGLQVAIDRILMNQQPTRKEANRFIANAYSWNKIARRTQTIFHGLEVEPLDQRVRKVWESGAVGGKIFAVIYLLFYNVNAILDWFVK